MIFPTQYKRNSQNRLVINCDGVIHKYSMFIDVAKWLNDNIV